MFLVLGDTSGISVGRFPLSAKKKAVATIIILVVIIAVGYFLILSASTGGGRGGNNGDNGGGLGSIDARTLVTLTVMGGSAFITGFGFRDVIGRAVAARQRARLKSAQQPVKP